MPDNKIYKQSYLVENSQKTSFSLNHTLKIDFDPSAIEVKVHLYLIDVNNKVKEEDLHWYK